VFSAEGLRIITTSPRINSICERVIGTVRRELLGRTLILNERQSRRQRPPGIKT
jgi:hypothetical protein